MSLTGPISSSLSAPARSECPGRLKRQLFVTFYAIFKGTVDLKNIVQLQEFKKLHNFRGNVTDFEIPVIVISSLHNGQENPEPGAVNKVNAFKVQYKLCIGLI